MNQQQMNHLSSKLAAVLDTHDKRWMFVRMCIPDMLPNVRLEGTPSSTCHDIVNEANKRGQIYLLSVGVVMLFPGYDPDDYREDSGVYK